MIATTVMCATKSCGKTTTVEIRRKFVSNVWRLRGIKMGRSNTCIIIPVHNQVKLVERLVSSIKTYTTGDWHVVIVDDASTEPNARKRLRALCTGTRKKFRLLWNQKQKGYAASCKKGAHKAYGGTRFYVFLNSDTEILTKDWLRKLTDPMFDDSFSAIGCLSNNAGLQSVPIINPEKTNTNHPKPGTSKADIANTVENREQQIFPCKIINGFALAVAGKAFRDVGGFDEVNFPHYGADDDLCIKLSRKQYKLGVINDLYIWHEKRASYQDEEFEIRKTVEDKIQEIHGDFADKERKRILDSNAFKSVINDINKPFEEKRTIIVQRRFKDKIGIGICAYRRPEQTARLIKSILAAVKTPHELVVGIDDIQDERTKDVCESLAIEHFIEVNRGNSVNRNRLMKVLYDKGCQYLFLLEDDLEVTDNFVIPYINVMKNTQIPLMCGLHPMLVEKGGKEGHFEVIKEEKLGDYNIVYPSGNSNIFIALTRGLLENQGYIDTAAYRNLYGRTTGLWLDKIRRKSGFSELTWPDVREGRKCYVYRYDISGGMDNERKKRELDRFREFDLQFNGLRQHMVLDYKEEHVVLC